MDARAARAGARLAWHRGRRLRVGCVWLSLALFLLAGCSGGEELAGRPDDPVWEVAPIWAGEPPGELVVDAEEARVLEDHGWRQITVLKEVSTPAVTVIEPPEGRANGAAMIVLPGGAFGVLAWDVEGTEVGAYLAELGITAFVLKYRVRTPTAKMWLSLPFQGLDGVMAPGREAASLDARQALRFVRANAGRFGIDPDRVGMMGFSAGGITLFRVLQDAEPAARPDIAASIYGMMFDEGVRPESTPLFIAVARDDESVEHSEAIAALWRQAGAPSELHVFDSGGHGFGLGRPGTDSAAFATLFATWLREQGFAAD